MSGMLDRVVTSVATQLMLANPRTASDVIERVLAQLVDEFDVDAGFLRHNNHRVRVSTLVAEWPPRYEHARPDPLAVVSFADANPLFALSENARRPEVVHPDPANDGFPCPVAKDGQESLPSVAMAPLVWGGAVTTGLLGFVKFGDRVWSPKELDLLEAIAALFAQLKAHLAAENRLQYLAEHDDLTDLHNRRALMAHLHERLAKSRPGPVAVMYLDVDRMKSINDYLGHSAGDWFIRVFAQRLRLKVGPGVIARVGGDEFVFVPNESMSADGAALLARQLQLTMQSSVSIGGELVSRSVSVGVAIGIPGRDTPADLVSQADQAALTAKRAGGNEVAVFTQDMSLRTTLQNDIDLHLRGVIDSDALILHYLPEVDMRTGEILAVEALVRWQHPALGLLLPDSFIAVAESTNAAGKLGRWVIRTACAEFSKWRSLGLGRDVMLRLNVSPVQLVANGFVRTVAESIAEFDIDAGSVCLEITERIVVGDVEHTQRTLATLKEVGVQIAIDDFGTGFAVLSHLKSLPVDMLKIDTTFVRELGSNSGDLAIVRAIIGLAEAFDLQLVAEGVETPAAALTLMRHGCYRAQGFLLSRPLTADAMTPLLAEGRLSMPLLAHDTA
ncbi:putative bifunctional diguanylate cyclase/phosphodiesterase [Mycobacterium scrofulaceum]|uniref:Bifunctional diguanylate cyclase/phosphodiesterase n=1 Tax=Mycobacterium scrofulaceum TaxID=1783 RepID=A0A1A2VW47_MYCSC|nr:EAL domain-containing protein [Mycobacterium scrofulaceum]OBI05554.1 hypothetical protein A5679_13290 [Mycobacterium scrofulaceum]